MNLTDRVAFGGLARALCVIVASKRPNFCQFFLATAPVGGMRNAIETPRKRPVAGHSNPQQAYLKGIELLDPSHSYYIHVRCGGVLAGAC